MRIIQQIIKALNLIEVRGADNMDRLLGCIQGLKKLDVAIDEKAKELKQHDDNDQPKQDISSAVD